MKISRLAGVAALLAAGVAQAQDAVKVNALIEVWYTQMTDSNLRLNTAIKPAGTSAYYDGMSSGRFNEDGVTIKRSEVYLSQAISEDIAWNLMFDPNNSTSSVGNNVLHDAVITWNLGKGFAVKAGQFKMPTTYEATLVAATNIYFFDRNQLNRQFGDKRDRGIWASYTYGDPKGFQGKLNVAVSNGNTDDGSSGKTAVDTNSQKDWTFRFEGGFGSTHKFGAYYREGVTNLKDSTSTYGAGGNGTTTWSGFGTPSPQQVKDNRDRTTLEGFFYAYDTAKLHFDFEYATGLLGRRYPSVFAVAGTAAAAVTMGREYLDQKFAGFAVTGVYKMGAHQLTGRYDVLNYNSGDNWYTNYNPYKETAPGVSRGANYSPKYTETTVGYNYVFVPAKYAAAKLKLDYIMRSKNFLAPRTGTTQVGEQGGNSLVASLGVGF